MAKKKTTTTRKTYTEYSIAKPLAFWGIIISGIAGFITLIIKVLIAAKIITGAGSAVNSVIGIMNLIANLALFASVFLVAYPYARSKNQTVWTVLFWVFSILAFLSLLGFNILSMFF